MIHRLNDLGTFTYRIPNMEQVSALRMLHVRGTLHDVLVAVG